VAVIAAFGGAELAAKAATTTIPIAFVAGYDPVKSGLVASLARPGGNLTGISFLATELVAKRLELLRDLVPAAVRVAVLVNPLNAVIAETQVEDMEANNSEALTKMAATKVVSNRLYREACVAPLK
jgi:putative ABC transport system substrate-binding protein